MATGTLLIHFLIWFAFIPFCLNVQHSTCINHTRVTGLLLAQLKLLDSYK